MRTFEEVFKYFDTLEEIYFKKCNEDSDINLLLPTLKKYSEMCEHVTEMGVRWVVSTYALMMGKPNKLISYDIIPLEHFGVNKNFIKFLGKNNDVDYEFILGDTTKLEIEPTDFLFIDTLHTYNQLKTELNLHSKKVNKYIGFHDTTTYGKVGEDGGLGLMMALDEFLKENTEWEICEKIEYNNGLTIIKKKYD